MSITWQSIVNVLAANGPGVVLRVPAAQVEHPRDGGLSQTVGAPYGQRASYRASLTDKGILCVEDFAVYYEAKIERVPPRIEVPAREPAGEMLGLAALGAFCGLAFGGTRQSVLTGTLLGGAVGLAGMSAREAANSPEVSKAALETAQTFVKLAISASSPQKGSSPQFSRGARSPRVKGRLPRSKRSAG